MQKISLIAAIFISISFAAVGFAASDTAILVTDMTSVDAATASVAAGKSGIPVFVLDNGQLTDNIRNDLQSFKTVIIIGGEAVVKPEVETELRNKGYNVVRLWGFERTGTAVEVARYFWPEGVSCLVAVDDTKNSDADSRIQIAASNLAARFNCTMIPVPNGTMPVEVLSTIDDLHAKTIYFVGRHHYPEISNKLTQFHFREFTGNDTEVENETDTEIIGTNGARLKLVIVATPNWKAAIAFASGPNHNSVVRFVTNQTNITALAEFIKSKNITDVRIVGVPAIADPISSSLAAEGINITKITGERASEIACKLVNRTKAEWDKRKAADDANKIMFRLKIESFLGNETNRTIAKLDAALTYLDSLSQTAGTESAKAIIEAAKARIDEVKTLLQSGNIDDARRLLFELKLTGNKKKIEMRDSLKINMQDEINEEEDDTAKAQGRSDIELSDVESSLAEIRSKCANSTAIDSIIAKAKDLRALIEAERSSGNFTGASNSVMELRRLVHTAKDARDTCRTKGRLSLLLGDLKGAQNETQEQNKKSNNTIEITAPGFSPKVLRVRQGTSVVWINEDTSQHWPASAIHTTHAAYPGSNINKCGTDDQSKIFDACRGLNQGENFTFVFKEVGSWGYHDHLNPGLTGTINVV